MTNKKRIEELERRVRELEARPQYVPVYYPIWTLPPAPPPTIPWWQQPWYATTTTTMIT